jgi:hypothetical protein
MNAILATITIVLLTMSYCVADEFETDSVVNCVGSTDNWRRIDQTRTIHNGEHWNWVIYKHVDNGDLLTFACYDAPSFLESAGTHDNALEFAPSGHPYWIHRNFGFGIGPVKMMQLELSVADRARNLPKTNVPVLEFVNVNENDNGETLMVNGYVFVLDQKTYYVQHTSRRPSQVTVARDAAECLIKSKLATIEPDNKKHRTKR